MSKLKSVGENRKIKETKFAVAYDSDEIIKTVSDYFNISRSEIFKKKQDNIHRRLTLYLIKNIPLCR